MELNSKNKFRVLLTEVLPYEVPLRFNNEAFYRNMLNKELYDKFIGFFSGFVNLSTRADNKSFSKPFNYNIRKYGGNETRTLSLIHPINQLEIADLYNEYSELMIYSCTKSSYSLRHINSEASLEIKKQKHVVTEGNDTKEDESDNDVEVENEEEQIFDKYASFFTYRDYDMVFKFYEGFEFIRLEQKYSYLRKIDIAKCFYNIYTHSFSWAIKGKDNAKGHITNVSFENTFDKVMQHSNYNETNGIVVGPEVSRIFAEGILQSVDENIILVLKEKGFHVGTDYEIRRYVDDYLIFTNSRPKLNDIEDVIKSELADYKLYLNMSKAITLQKPFMTNETKARLEVDTTFNNLLIQYFVCNNEEKINQNKAILNLIHSFCGIAKNNNISYGVISGRVLSKIRKLVTKTEIISQLDSSHLVVLIELSFYAFNLDMCFSTSIKLSSILCFVRDSMREKEACDGFNEVRDLVVRQLKQTADIYLMTQTDGITNVEMQNLFLCVSDMWEYKLPESTLMRIYGIDLRGTLDYFQICNLLYLCSDDLKYGVLKLSVFEIAKAKIVSKDIGKNKIDTEKTFLYLDLITCPFLTDKQKKEIIVAFNGTVKNSNKLLTEAKKIGRWFFDWNKDHKLSDFILKKNYYTTYE